MQVTVMHLERHASSMSSFPQCNVTVASVELRGQFYWHECHHWLPVFWASSCAVRSYPESVMTVLSLKYTTEEVQVPQRTWYWFLQTDIGLYRHFYAEPQDCCF